MKIISGIARNTPLDVPEGLAVRPTAVRARKALFDSLNSKWRDAVVLDIFAGSGALGLEAASRGAAKLMSVEKERDHSLAINANSSRVCRAGFTGQIAILNCDVISALPQIRSFGPTVVFADPPYADSLRWYLKLLNDPEFIDGCGGAFLVWELPDTPGSSGEFVNAGLLQNQCLRTWGGVDFITGEIRRVHY